MKILALILSLVSLSAFGQAAKVGQIHKTVATAATPERVSSTDLYVKKAWVQCSSANTGTTCFLGNSAANAVAAKGMTMSKPTATAVAPALELGDMGNGSLPKINLKEIWVDVATSGDEVNVFYIE